jgi:hypothetical protein
VKHGHKFDSPFRLMGSERNSREKICFRFSISPNVAATRITICEKSKELA